MQKYKHEFDVSVCTHTHVHVVCIKQNMPSGDRGHAEMGPYGLQHWDRSHPSNFAGLLAEMVNASGLVLPRTPFSFSVTCFNVLVSQGQAGWLTRCK